jgi:hypothetical protein
VASKSASRTPTLGESWLTAIPLDEGRRLVQCAGCQATGELERFDVPLLAHGDGCPVVGLMIAAVTRFVHSSGDPSPWGPS